MIRALAIALALACTGCFDFAKLDECNGRTAIACDGFEHGLDANVWTPSMAGGATGDVDGVHAHSGGKAFHAATALPATADKYFLQSHDLPSDRSLPLHVRAFVLVPRMNANNVVLATMVEGGGPTQVRVVLEAPGTLEVYDGVTSVGGHSTVTLPVGRWACLEWEVDQGSPGAMQLWLDDQPIAHYEGNTPTSTLATASIGIAYFASPTDSTAFDVWFDDVVVDTQRITCAQ